MHIVPNNKLSNHYRKKTIRKQVWIDDQSVSGSFYQNLGTMKEKTKIGMFYEDYLNPVFSFSDNFCPDFYSGCSSMVNNDFSNSIMNPYANRGVEGINNVLGGDINSLGDNNNVFVEDGVFSELTDSQNVGWTVMIDYEVNSETLTQEYTFRTNPTVNQSSVLTDSDADGLTDGQEVNGWTVMIAKEDSSGEMETQEYVFKTNPAENNSNLNLDSDRDGILDKDEIGMSNLCDYYQGVTGWKNADSYHQDLYNKYSWFIENRVEKATSWSAWNETIQSQFNPYVKENIPPIITAFKSDFEYDTTWYGLSFDLGILGSYSVGLSIIESIWVKTTVGLFDAGEVSSLTIGLSTGISIPTLSWSGITYEELVANIGSQTYTNIESGKNSFEFIKSVDGLTWAVGQAIGFDAEVTVTDVGGEVTTITLHRDGLFDKAWDFLTEIWSQMAGAVTAAINAVMSVLNGIIDTLINIIEEFIEGLVDTVNNLLSGFIQDVKNLLDNIQSLTTEQIVVGFFDLLFKTTIAFLAFGLAASLCVVFKIVQVSSLGMGYALGHILSPIITGLAIFIASGILGFYFLKYTGSQVIADSLPSDFDKKMGWTVSIASVIFLLNLQIAQVHRGLPSLVNLPIAFGLSLVSLALMYVASQLEESNYDTNKIIILKIMSTVAAIASIPVLIIKAGTMQAWYPYLYPLTLGLGTIVAITALITMIDSLSQLNSGQGVFS